MAKSALRIKARILRKQGYGVKTIANKIHVSSSTVSLWCRDIILTPDQISELEIRAHDPYYGKRLQYVHRQQQLRLNRLNRLYDKGIKQVGNLSKKELFTSGISLYWAEGFKCDNQVGFSNTDPKMIRFFIYWLEKCCNIDKTRLKLRLGINISYSDKAKCIEDYWSKELSIPKNQFQKPYFQKVKWKKIYENPSEYHGVLRIRVSKSSNLLRTIYGWIEGLKQNCLT